MTGLRCTRRKARVTARRSAWPYVVGVLGWVLFASTVWAQTSAADKAAAEALFNQGRELVDQGRFDEACPKFEASLKLDEGLGTQLHLADCYERWGKLASAWALFKEVESLANVRSDPERGPIARVRADALEPRLTRLVIAVPGQLPEGFEITRNGKPVLPVLYNTSTPVDAGTSVVRATAPGYEPFEASLSLTEQGTFTFAVPELKPLPEKATTVPTTAPAKDAAPDESGRGNSQRTIGLVVAGAGLVAGIVSVVFTVRAAQKNSDSKDQCDDDNNCREAGFAARNDAFDLADVATVAGIVGVVGVGAGTALYFTAPRDSGASDQAHANATHRGATLGLWWEGTW